MSTDRTEACLACASTDTQCIGNVESGELGPSDPPTDIRVWHCNDCGNEWEIPKP